MNVTTFTVGPLQENCYLVADGATNAAVLVDPGAEGERLVAAVRAAGLDLMAIWLTHAHFDHVGGIAAVRRAWPVPVHLHPADAPIYARATASAAAFGLQLDAPPPVDVALEEGDELRVGSLAFDVLHLPGHAPGHVAFHGHGVAFAGDCLFAGSVGRTDLPLADPRQLAASLVRLTALPDSTVIHPGHGPATTIGAERATNPFLNGSLRLVRG